MFANGRWFSPASSTTKTGRHDIAEILLKVALNTKNQIWLIWHFLGKLETFQKGKLPIVYLKYLYEAKYLTVYNVAFQSFDFERTWWRLFQKRALIWYLRVSFGHCVVCSSSIELQILITPLISSNIKLETIIIPPSQLKKY